MRFSVIIPALNEEKNIEKCLKSIRNQDYPRNQYEIIVVDGNSSDKTREIARKYAKVLVEKRRKIGLARNVGARAAKGDILIFVDADTAITGNLFEETGRAFSNKKVVGATAKILPNRRTSYFLLISLFFNFMIRTSIYFGRPLSFTFCTACRRDEFREIKGFSEKLYSMEDMDFSYRLSKLGRYRFLTKVHSVTSMRKFENWSFPYAVYRYFRASGILGGPGEIYERVD